jgi:hypothetical protein
MKSSITPCGAKNRKGTPCRQPVIPGRSRCHYHGGISLRGEESATYQHGYYTKDAKAQRKLLRDFMKALRQVTDR